LTFNLTLSAWLWYLLISITFWKGEFDEPENIWMRMNLMGMIVAVILPRTVVCLFHFTGKLLRIRSKGYIKSLTDISLWIAISILLTISLGTFIGRFNFRTEEMTIKIRDLHPGLDGLKIVQISDLHLSGYHKNTNKLEKAISIVNSLQPDLVFNTGDFISYGWREYADCDTIIIKEQGRLGKFAVLGNHDMGTYLPNSTEADRQKIIEMVSEKIILSGYNLLNNENTVLEINGARLFIIGVTTSGRHPDIIHGNLEKSMKNTESADLKILLAHDPNQWEEDVAGKTDIELTLSGHTHGMQFGIITKKVRWSPVKYIYPHWNGLFSNGEQFHYVNRGLGLLSIPFRIWMPPEITLIRLEAD
jgi:predicted MPP superfamily phosphohydrolase